MGISYRGKAIFEGDITRGNRYREKYLDSVNRFIEKKIAGSSKERDAFMQDIVVEQETYRKRYLEMIGQPVSEYPEDIPAAKMEFAGCDDFCDIYYV